MPYSLRNGSQTFSLYLCRIPLIWAKLLFIGQRLMCKYFFVEDKGKESSKFIPVKHRYMASSMIFKQLSCMYQVSYRVSY
jgi:hypothetical protein